MWSLRGNFLDVPTDCPQRDERLGWTGDIAVFAPTAAYLYDVSAFLDEWLANVDVEQAAADGLVAHVIPDNIKYDVIPDFYPQPESTAIWSDAAVWVPWALWQAYGDREALARHYPAMLAHTRRVKGLLSPNLLWDNGFQFGDWLDPTAPPDAPFQAKADTGVVATACYILTLARVAETARILGRDAEAAEFADLRDRVRAAFLDAYVDPSGRIHSDRQTVYALAIAFDVLTEAHAEQFAGAGRRLADLEEHDHFHIATGFAGTAYVLDALTRTGHLDTAYRLMLNRDCPGWLYPVLQGATTIWERWDSMLADGSINPGEMTSFNHYALGAVADWMHRTIGGLAPLAPGYERVLIAPQPGGGLTSASTSLRTRYGVVCVRWHLTESGLHVEAEVPIGVEGVVRLPGEPDQTVGCGHHHFTKETAHAHP